MCAKGGNIILGSEDRKIQGLTIESGGQGIDNKNGSVYVYGDEDSVISINANNAERLTDENENNQAAIANECNGEIFIKGDIISLKTNTSYKEDFYGNPTDPVFGDGIRNVSNGTATLNMESVASSYEKTILNAFVQLKNASSATITSAIVSDNTLTIKCSNLSGTPYDGTIPCTVLLFLV